VFLKVIPAENIVAAFQGCQETVFAISKNHAEAQVFFEVKLLLYD
jgi:3-dehydroquinate synthase class II